MFNHSSLRNRIRDYRKSFGLTQTQLASLVFVSKNTICCLENGDFYPSAYTAALLCQVFNCKFEDLFYLEV